MAPKNLVSEWSTRLMGNLSPLELIQVSEVILGRARELLKEELKEKDNV
jgi:hypothetical protein